MKKIYGKYFSIGNISFSQKMKEKIKEDLDFEKELENILQKYVNKDWSETEADYIKQNQNSLIELGEFGCNILTTYQLNKDKIMIQTSGKGVLRKTRISLIN